MADTLDLFGAPEPEPVTDPDAEKRSRAAFEYLARKNAPPAAPASVNDRCVEPGCDAFGPWGWMPTNSRWCTIHLPSWWKAHGTPLAL